MMDTFLATRPAVPASRQIRVFIAEDHRITLWGLQKLIEAAHPRMVLAGTATTRLELVNHAALADTDVVLLDLDLAGEDGLASLRDLQRLCSGKVLVLTGSNSADAYRSAMVQGARGVLHKGQSAEVLLNAIEKVHEGQLWLERGLLGQVLGELTGATPRADNDIGRRVASLTVRERQIVSAIARSAGLKLQAIADALCMSEHTLRNHLTAIYGKLSVRGRLELHLFATEHGLGAREGSRVS